MSVKVMSQVWQSELPRDEKYILLAYADHANDYGDSIFPSVGHTAWKTGYSDRSVQIITAKLIERGVLKPAGKGPGFTNRYSIVLDALPQRGDYRGVKKLHPVESAGGEESSGVGVKNLHPGGEESAPKSSLTIHEPSLGADAPLASSGDSLADFVAAFGEAPVIVECDPPRNAEELRERVLQAEAGWLARMQEPWVKWGGDSTELDTQLRQHNGRSEIIRRLGYELDTTFGLRPVWTKRSDVKSWVCGLIECLDVTDDNRQMVLDAAMQLRENEMNISDPWSLVKTARSLAAKKRIASQPKHITVSR